MQDNSLYIFDLDKTLIAKDSWMLWHEYLIENNIIKDSSFLAQDKKIMQHYSQGNLDLSAYINFSLSAIEHFTVDEIKILTNDFIEKKIKPSVYNEAKYLLASLKNKNVIIISATLNFLVEPIAEFLGDFKSLAIELDIKDNYYTPNIKGIATFQYGKVKRLFKWLYNHEIKFERLIFYTDSCNDLPLCHFADKVFLINPDDTLHRASLGQKNWFVLNW